MRLRLAEAYPEIPETPTTACNQIKFWHCPLVLFYLIFVWVSAKETKCGKYSSVHYTPSDVKRKQTIAIAHRIVYQSLRRTCFHLYFPWVVTIHKCLLPLLLLHHLLFIISLVQLFFLQLDFEMWIHPTSGFEWIEFVRDVSWNQRKWSQH